MTSTKAALLDDIQREIAIAARVYRATVLATERLDERVVRVSFRSNKVLDGVKDQLEAGKAWVMGEDAGGAGGQGTTRWRILSVGDEVGEADVFFLISDGGGPVQSPSIGTTLFVQPFNYIEPVHESLSLDSPAAWAARTSQALGWMSGAAVPSRAASVDAVFRSDLDAAWNAEMGCVWGPPGTGKTWTLGQQVALAARSGARVLVVSTTNDATDVAAAEIMGAIKNSGAKGIMVKRVGSGVRHSRFSDPANPRFYHPSVLPEDDPELVAQIATLEADLRKATDSNEKNRIKARVSELRRALADHATRCILDPTCRVVVATAFTAVSRLVGSPGRLAVRLRAEGGPLFDALCIDEAGLVSAPLAAALTPYSSRRVLLFGDPRQLAPIAKQSAELKQSSLAQLARPTSKSMTLLTQQRRMDPPIREVVSRYTYDLCLKDGDLSGRPPFGLPKEFGAGSLQVVFLDDATMANGRVLPLSSLGAARGDGGQSYQRVGTAAVLKGMMQAHPALTDMHAAFISPFRAQVRFVRAALTAGDEAPLRKGHKWSFTTVHAQQGGEAPLILFDTVDLTKVRDWHVVDPKVGISEWQRLLNVAISRGQRAVLVLTTRHEWNSSAQPHVRGLREAVAATPSATYASWDGVRGRLVSAKPGDLDPLLRAPRQRTPGSFGERVETIALQRPVLTSEQRELAEQTALDGPWLVRGAPGSGKTLALAEWAVRTAGEHPRSRVGIVHFTSALGSKIQEEVTAAGQRLGIPSVAARVRVCAFHRGVLKVTQESKDWQGETESAARLASPITPQFDALFVDEAQDFGPAAIRFLTASTAGSNIRVLLDPMQATGNTAVTDWAALGFTRPRWRVLKESHRSTRTIADMAMNLYAELGGDTASMLEDGLVFPVTVGLGRLSRAVLATDFVLDPGRTVTVRRFGTDGAARSAELDWVAGEILRLIDEEDLKPADIGIVVNPIFLRGARGVGMGFANIVKKGLQERLPELALRKGLGKATDEIQVHGLNNVKGLEFEVVLMVGADTLAPHPTGSERVIRAPDLYTAATRARQHLIITGTDYGTSTDRATRVNVLDAATAFKDILSSPDFDEARHQAALKSSG